jgi:hypothetical protein
MERPPIFYPWISRINIVKMTVLLKAIYISNAMPIKISVPLFAEVKNIKSKIHMEKMKDPE